jgi:PAS domain S-box-containing protein
MNMTKDDCTGRPVHDHDPRERRLAAEAGRASRAPAEFRTDGGGSPPPPPAGDPAADFPWPALAPLSEACRPTHLLVVDGDADRSGHWTRILAVRYEVQAVNDAGEALVAAMVQPPDVVLADLLLLRRRQFELLHALKSGTGTRHVPVIAVVAGAAEEPLAEALEAGVDDFLVKPFSRSELFTRIEAARARRAVEEARHEVDAGYRTLLDTMADGVLIVQDRRFVAANRALTTMLGYAEHGCVGLGFEAVVAQEDLELWNERYRRTVGDGPEPHGRYETAFLCQDGQRLDLELTIRRIPYDGRWAMLGIVRDTRGQRQLEAAQIRLIRMIEASQDYIGLTEPDGKLIYLNRAGRRLLGLLAPDELAALSIADHLAPWARERVLKEAIPEVLSRGSWTGETALIGRDGAEIPVSQMILAHRSPDGRVEYLSTVARDLSDRRRAEEALREADRRKDEFIAMLAHELRNPLAPIRNAVQVLREPGLPKPDAQWARDVLDRQVARMSRLLDDLLDVSRVTHGIIALRRAPLDLATVVEHAVETSRPLIVFRRHGLKVNLPSEAVRVDGDATRLGQVISNLLNNAAQYTEPGGRIELSLEAAPGEAVVRVCDNGRGIDAELLPHVFEVFTQNYRPLDRTEGGLGLGLALVRRLVDMHGGRVEAHSAGPGRGAEFVVRLPRLAAVAPAEGRASGGGPASRSGGLRVLVVDDNVDSADSMAMLLSLDGYEVRTAFDGPGALAEALEFHPQVILLDIGLPGMDGYEVARRIRELPGVRDTLMIAITGYGQDDDRARSRAAGFDHHLVKPVDPDTLSALLETMARG